VKTKRPPTSPRQKVDCLLDRVHRQFGAYLKCELSGEDMKPGDPVEFDHVHAVVLGGRHTYKDLRPVLKDPHKKKTTRDVAAKAKINRLTGKTKGRPKRRWKSRPFPKRQKSFGE
jgi:5-methylcytosine-specific restriction endonuclease McrA